MIETDREKEIFQQNSTDFLKEQQKKIYSRYASFGVVFAEMFNLTIRDILIKPVFEKGESNLLDFLPIITKQYFNRIHFSTELTLIQASLKKNEKFVHKN